MGCHKVQEAVVYSQELGISLIINNTSRSRTYHEVCGKFEMFHANKFLCSYVQVEEKT
jgi:hypothetical protein